MDGNVPHGAFESSHVRSATSALTTDLGWGVDADEDHVGVSDSFGAGGGEEEVGQACRQQRVVCVVVALAAPSLALGLAISRGADHIDEAGLVYGQMAALPGVDAGVITVDDGNPDMRVVEGDDGGGGTTYWAYGCQPGWEAESRVHGQIATRQGDSPT